MLWVCPATGHLFNRQVIAGHVLPADAFCPHHGVPLFHECSQCGERWTVTSNSYSNRPTDGTDFCNACGTPAPWLSREQKVTWIQHQIQASRDIDPATRDELIEVVE